MIDVKRAFAFIDSQTGEIKKVNSYTLKTEGCPLSVVLTDFGARWVSAPFCMSDGSIRDFVWGYEDIVDYYRGEYYGAVVGRFANRIAKGKFSLDGKDYSLYVNNGENHLHGGKNGFDRKVWNAEANDSDEPSVTFSTLSPDGDENYPGNLVVSVRYTLKKSGSLLLEYGAFTDKATPLNITNHAYFNLCPGSTAEQHVMSLDADRYLPTDEGLIPTGEMRPVDGTVFDFRKPKLISEASSSEDSDIVTGGGIDHCFIFSDSTTFGPKGRVVSPDNKVSLELYTDMPCVQVYTGNFLSDDGIPFRSGPKKFRGSFCLETELMPDSPNRPGFTDCILRPGCYFETKTQYSFAEIK